MKELKEKNYISHRLYKYLRVAFQNTPKNFKKYELAIHGVKEYDYAEFNKRQSEYYDEMKQEFANSNYCLTVNILTKKYEEYESTTFEGTITIDNRKGTSKTISILCKCGC